MKIVVLDQISERMQELCKHYLGTNHDVIFCQRPDDYKQHIATSHVLVTFTNGIQKELLQEAKHCVFIQKLGTGVNNIDIEGASERNIPVANTLGLNATSVAEHTVSLITATYKHLLHAHNSMVQQGNWLKTDLRDRSYELSYKKVGLIGFGNIGRKVRKLLSGYECEMYYYDIAKLSPEEENTLGIQYLNLDELLKEVDVVSLHIPLNKHTHHLMDKKRLLSMKDTAVLINTCRGGVIDEDALYHVLKSGHLTGAALDVFETEPVRKGHQLGELPNVIMTPHIGGGTVEAMEAVIRQASENINCFLETREVAHPHTLVNANDLRVSH